MQPWFHCSRTLLTLASSGQLGAHPAWQKSEDAMLDVSQAPGTTAPSPVHPAKDAKTPCCCGQEMQILLRRAVLHSDGSVDFRTAWGCPCCGRRIL